MSRALFSRNEDLKRLRDEGYFVQVVGGFLVMREVPYVNAEKQVKTGTLISSLTMAGDQSSEAGYACHALRRRLPLRLQRFTDPADFASEWKLRPWAWPSGKALFSSKPNGGYTDYFHKMTTYALDFVRSCDGVEVRCNIAHFPSTGSGGR